MIDEVRMLLTQTLALTKVPYHKDFLETLALIDHIGNGRQLSELITTEMETDDTNIVWLGRYNRASSQTLIDIPSCLGYSIYLGVELVDVLTHVALNCMYQHHKHTQDKEANIYKAEDFAKKYMKKIGLRPIVFIPTNALESAFMLQALMAYREWTMDKTMEMWYNKRRGE